jgi:hypothetical protein
MKSIFATRHASGIGFDLSGARLCAPIAYRLRSRPNPVMTVLLQFPRIVSFAGIRRYPATAVGVDSDVAAAMAQA